MTTTQKWLRLIAWLRRNFPSNSPVYIRSTSMKNLHGYTERECGYYQIEIKRKQSFALRTDTLIHEWAHILTWLGAETDIEDHSAEWGIQYAKIYRTFLEWNWGKRPDEER